MNPIKLEYKLFSNYLSKLDLYKLFKTCCIWDFSFILLINEYYSIESSAHSKQMSVCLDKYKEASRKR